ncbi:D-arabinitol 2-dehydrogenase [Fusarium beomiforme]|uniref:D-arabinitol 2-dehydrogenase n=1 Tax=Fusarium beomiforme TaxID=44412 RepID=A0A9P5DRI2_9HYPO|nr:D-arabinitol 2-dehydrogenase [Fusarium beomiforme]
MTHCQRAEVLKHIDVRDLFLLNSRTIIVTGATGGLGLQVVKATLQAGADVIAIDQSPSTPKGDDWEALIATANRNGTLLHYWCCDVTIAELTRQTFEQAVSKCRYPLRGLVHCAGIGWVGDTINFKVEEARQIIDVNLMGTWICAQTTAQLIQKHNLPASLVFIARHTYGSLFSIESRSASAHSQPGF